MSFDQTDEDFINIDLDEVDDGRTPVPDGSHIVEVLSAEKKQKEGSAYPYIEVTMRIPSGEYANKKLWVNLSFNPKALWNMKLFCAGAGVKWTKQGFRMSDIVGKRLAVTTKIQDGFKDPNQKVNAVNPPYTQAA